MANGIYKITEDFEKALGDYTGAPYVVTVDNMIRWIILVLRCSNFWVTTLGFQLHWKSGTSQTIKGFIKFLKIINCSSRIFPSLRFS